MATLILGEGNFSYASSLVSQTFFDENTRPDLYATSFDDFVTCNKKYGSSFVENVQCLRSNNVRVLFNIDATRLPCHLKNALGFLPVFERIIFNFPHIGKKAGIHKNRYTMQRLLLTSCISLLNIDMCIYVSCRMIFKITL